MAATQARLSLLPGDTLVIVDVQNDFLPGGSLAVPDGDKVVPVLNAYLTEFEAKGLPIFATRCWHPADHCSFKPQGGPWPVHCVAGTSGAAFAPGLRLPPPATIISKATEAGRDAYSGFAATDLAQRLTAAGAKRLFVGGLATDYCVLNTVRDGLAAGFAVMLLADAIAAVNVEPDDGKNAEREMARLGAVAMRRDMLAGWQADVMLKPRTSVLLTDLYQLTMLQAYFDRGMNDIAVFELFVRTLPPERNFLLVSGLEQVVDYLEDLRFTSEELDWLASTGRFTSEFLRSLEGLRFTGDVHAVPEGTIFFPDEPILRVTAPLREAQLVESRVMNLVHYQTVVASKAVRCAFAAPGKLLVDFGLRRAHGAEAGVLSARASYIAGFSGTATVLAGALFDIPLYGTMAHSFIQAHQDEALAFEDFVRSHPANTTLLIDTYDTELAAQRIVALASRWRSRGIAIGGVRLDSGDLADHARRVRAILDAGGLTDVRIFASGNLDEYKLRDLVGSGAPIDGFGVGTRMNTSADAAYLDTAYKLEEYAGQARRKRSEAKATWPGRKQVYRRVDERGRIAGDVLALEEEMHAGVPLLRPIMRNGGRLVASTSLRDVRNYAAQQVAALPEPLRALEKAEPYPVSVSGAVRELARRVDEASSSHPGYAAG